MLRPHDDYRYLSHTRNPLQLKESETSSSVVNEIDSHGKEHLHVTAIGRVTPYVSDSNCVVCMGITGTFRKSTTNRLLFCTSTRVHVKEVMLRKYV